MEKNKTKKKLNTKEKPLHPLERFKKTFGRLEPSQPIDYESLYDENVHFEDPFQTLDGLPALKRYFDRLNANVAEGHFEFGDEWAGPHTAMITWTMVVRLRFPRKEITVSGATHLRFNGKVTYHRDYFDAAALFYDQVPFLRTIIGLVKSSL